MKKSIDTEVIAIGPYSRAISEFGELDSTAYDHVREGNEIIFKVFWCNSKNSEFLAEALGCDPNDINTYMVDIANVDRQKLVDLCYSKEVDWGFVQITKFFELHAYGFRFFYHPNRLGK